MRILFISRLKYLPQAGPTYSVPSQISSLSEIESVLWVNIEQEPCESWSSLPFYKGAKEGIGLSSLPEEFMQPDLVVFQCVYHLRPCKIISDVRRRKIPYIVIPRSALTANAQLKSRKKKALGNAFFYRGFVRDALAVQFLTKSEFADSGIKWNAQNIVVPNGIDFQNESKHSFRSSGRCISFIGRYEPYQKGIDVLIEAVESVKDELRTSGIEIFLHGSNGSGSAEGICSQISDAGIDDIVRMNGPAFGEEKRAALLNADAFIMTSRYEGMPMGLLEALSYGLPCIVTPGTNMAAEIESAKAGWTCECNAESVASTLIAFARADDLSERSANAIQLASRYEWSEIAKRTADAYSELLKMR